MRPSVFRRWRSVETSSLGGAISAKSRRGPALAPQRSAPRRIPTDIQRPVNVLAPVAALLRPPKGLSIRPEARTGSRPPSQPPDPIHRWRNKSKAPELVETNAGDINQSLFAVYDANQRGYRVNRTRRKKHNRERSEAASRGSRGSDFANHCSRITPHSSPLATQNDLPAQGLYYRNAQCASYARKVANTCRRWEASK